MIVSLHVATGALAGAAAGSRLGAVALGPFVHALGDLTPHQDFASTKFEAATGGLGVVLFARRFGPLHPVTLGAIAASVWDIEHVLRPGRRGRRELFPTHRYDVLHNRSGLPAWLQLGAAAAIIAALVRRGGSSE